MVGRKLSYLESAILAKLLSDPLPLGNDLKILVLSFVASERRDGGNNEIGEERGDSWHSLSRLPKPADWIGRDGSVVHVCPPTVRDRAPIQTADIKSCRFFGLAIALRESQCTREGSGPYMCSDDRSFPE